MGHYDECMLCHEREHDGPCDPEKKAYWDRRREEEKDLHLRRVAEKEKQRRRDLREARKRGFL